MSQGMDLQAFFYPQTVAVICASDKPDKVGHTIVTNMLGAGYSGRLISGNHKAGTIESLPVPTAVTDQSKSLDLAVTPVPCDGGLSVFKELFETGAKLVILITVGSNEVGKECFDLERDVAEMTCAQGMALLGFNYTWA